MLGFKVTTLAPDADVATVVVFVVVGWLLLEDEVDILLLRSRDDNVGTLSTADKDATWVEESCEGAQLVCGLVSVIASSDGFDTELTVAVVTVFGE